MKSQHSVMLTRSAEGMVSRLCEEVGYEAKNDQHVIYMSSFVPLAIAVARCDSKLCPREVETIVRWFGKNLTSEMARTHSARDLPRSGASRLRPRGPAGARQAEPCGKRMLCEGLLAVACSDGRSLRKKKMSAEIVGFIDITAKKSLSVAGC